MWPSEGNTGSVSQGHEAYTQWSFNVASMRNSLFIILWSAEAFHNILHLHDLLILIGLECLQPLHCGHSTSRYTFKCCLPTKPLEQDFSAMFDLKSKLLQLLRAHLVGLFFFVVHFNGQGMHFLWRYFAIRLRYIIILVKILD